MSRSAEQLRSTFPEIERIEDDELEAGVVEAWSTSLDEVGVDDLAAVPWMPPVQRDLGIPDETLVDHVRDVTQASVALAERIAERRDVSLSMDAVVAGALVHDVSKLYEFDGMDDTATERLLGHPYFGVHVAARAGLPTEIQHVVLSHSPRTAVDPATLEAAIVQSADVAAASAIRAAAVDDIREA